MTTSTGQPRLDDVYCSEMAFGTDWVGRMLRAAGSNKGEREAQQEYHQPNYGAGVSFKSALIGVALFVAVLVGVYLLFT